MYIHYTHACMHVHMFVRIHLYSDMKIIKIKAKDLNENTTNIFM